MRSALETGRYREYIQQSQAGFDASLQVFASHLWRDAEGHVSRPCEPLFSILVCF